MIIIALQTEKINILIQIFIKKYEAIRCEFYVKGWIFGDLAEKLTVKPARKDVFDWKDLFQLPVQSLLYV